jgi:adenosylcobinamide-phosphate synthase
MVIPAIILWLSLAIDRLFGDPPNFLHPTAYVGRFIGWWGRPAYYPVALQRISGIVLTLATALLYAIPFFLVERYAPGFALLIAGPFLLKICFAWRCLEEHVCAVLRDDSGGQEPAQMLVSRDTSGLGEEEVLSAAYESMSENLTDSIISPLFFYTFFGLSGAAFYRAVNTADAMLGYTDERARIGWFAARLDDILNFIPARVAGFILLGYFAARGRFGSAWRIFLRDRRSRPGINGGIPMALIAGGAGVRFEKPGVYTIGDPERTLSEAGDDIVTAVRVTTLAAALIYTGILLVFPALPW